MLLGNKGNVILTKKIWFSDKLWLNVDMTNATSTNKAPCEFCSADSIRHDKVEYSFSSVKAFKTFFELRYEKDYIESIIHIECFVDSHLITHDEYEAMTPHELDLFLDCFYPEV